jgi:tetratricopeptide (TPR) repeat protein
MLARILLAALSLMWVSTVAAQPSLVAQLEVAARTYHQEPSILDRLRLELMQASEESPTAEHLTALARVLYNWAEVRAASVEAKLEALDRGRAAAARAVEMAPSSANARFWHAVNAARWGELRGMAGSLSVLGLVRRESRAVLELDPKFAPGYTLAGAIAAGVPSMLGGDLQRAETLYRQGLAIDATLTSLRVGLAKVLLRTGRAAEAREELQKVVAEDRPANLADWTLKDVPEARSLLERVEKAL